MKKILIFISVLISVGNVAFSQGGMWLPNEIKGDLEKKMKLIGLKIKADQIYSETKPSIKDAIVQFGRGCTGSIISDEGLVITNHHCGYGAIQRLSTIENNILRDGYWSKNYITELPAQGLTVTIINKIEEVTTEILNGVEQINSVSQNQSIIDKNVEKLISDKQKETFQTLEIKPFYNGNKYYLFYKTVYKDIRLVGTAPESIGKFGADTDNWMWPRHNADFALFRIYADKDNNPAEYSAENVPYVPKYSIPVSKAGVEEGDFTMVFGFPGRTSQFIPAAGVDLIANKLDPISIELREKTLNVLDKYMRNDEAVKLKFASKYAGIANFWKKMIGENQGINRVGALSKKLEFESELNKRINLKPELQTKYGNLLNTMNKLYESFTPISVAENMIDESFASNIDLMRLLSVTARLKTVYENNGEKAAQEYKTKILSFAQRIYSEFDHDIDKEIFYELTKIFLRRSAPEFIPASLVDLKTDDDIKKFSNYIYTGKYSSFEKYKKLIDTNDIKYILAQFDNDPAYNLALEINSLSDNKISPEYNRISTQLDSLQKIYTKAQLDLFPKKSHFPDANSTLRLTYGQVKSYSPRDAVLYKPITHIEGIMEKYKKGDYEFDLPQKFIDLYKSKDYGMYKDKTGSLPVCFIGTNQTTGGNSGSPVLDAYGNFIGINFDRVWEGTMSDLYFDPAICRNVMADARFIMFIIEKFSDSDRIIKEMKLVKPKGK